jgi:hypothetical protein
MNRKSSENQQNLSLEGLSPAIVRLVKLGQMVDRDHHNLHTSTVAGFRCPSAMSEEIRVRREVEERSHSSFMRHLVRFYLASVLVQI